MKNELAIFLVILLTTTAVAQVSCQSCNKLSPENNSLFPQDKILLPPSSGEPLARGSGKSTLQGSIFIPFSGNHSPGKITFWGFSFGGQPPYLYKWFSNKDGLLSKSQNFSINLSLGEHKIILEINDAEETTFRNHLFLTVKKQSLTATITSPVGYQTYTGGEKINLSSLVLGGREPYQLTWSINGKEVNPLEFEIPSFARNHTLNIDLTVQDANSTTISAAAEILIVGHCSENAICDAGEDFQNCPHDCPSGSLDGYCDGADDGVCDPDCQRQLDSDCLCNNDLICEEDWENYDNCPRDCPASITENYSEYLWLVILILLLLVIYFKFKRFIIPR